MVIVDRSAAPNRASVVKDIDFVHTGPGTLAGRYMRRFWQPVLRSQDLAPGRAKPIRIMSEDFTVYRGEGGAAHVLAFRCAHRGTQLSTGWVEGDDLRCFYHGWKYAADGRCLEQPAEPEPFCEKVRIRSYPTEEYVGLIFAYLGEGEPPLPRYPQMEEPGPLKIVGEILRCNFFNALENDPVHGYFVHRRPGNDWREWGGEVPMTTAEECEVGIVERTWRPQGEVSLSYKGMPNLAIRKGRLRETEQDKPGYFTVAWKVPVDDESHWRFAADRIILSREAAAELVDRSPSGGGIEPTVTAGLAERVLSGSARIEDLDTGSINLVNLQDHVSQGGQGTIVDRGRERLGRTDVGVILLRKIWVRELRALAEGRPLIEWRLPPELKWRASAASDAVKRG